MAATEAQQHLSIGVAYSPHAGAVDERWVKVPAGATIGCALRHSGVLRRHPDLDPATAVLGIWGQLRPLDALLRDGDRVEIYRPLQVDPKAARRLRQNQQRRR